MVRDQVEKTMRKALLSFAGKEQRPANDISLFIHTKPTEDAPALSPKYFYAVEGKPVTEEGKLKDLDFTKDILGKKIDMLGQSYLASQFLTGYFEKTCKKHEVEPNELYVRIDSKDSEAKALKIALYKNAEVLKKIKLEEIFLE